MHTWQQCLVTTSQDVLTSKYGFNRRWISSLSIDNSTNNLAGSAGWYTFEATHAGSLPHASSTSVAWNKMGRGNSLNALVPTSPSGHHTTWWWGLPDVCCAKIKANGDTRRRKRRRVSHYMLEIGHDKGKARCFTVVSATIECWHTQFRHVRYV